MKANVVKYADTHAKDLGGGLSRKVLSHTPDMMVVEVAFEKGGVGAMHTHPHVQSTYVISGAFEFTIGGEKVVVRQGDTITFESGVEHGTLCLEDGAVLDVFAPWREDFLK
jgi:quercetin dioxygenase-like cupin family protein